MPVLEMVMVGMVTALFGCSPLTAIKPSKPLNYDSINTIVVAGNVFLAHRQSLGDFFDSIGTDVMKPAKADALASVSFDEDVDRLLSHGW